MSVKSGQSLTVMFSTRHPATGAPTDADATPVVTLYVNGTADAATVTESNVTTGRYKAAVTLPTLAVGDVCDLIAAATVATVAMEDVIFTDVCDHAQDDVLTPLGAIPTTPLLAGDYTAPDNASAQAAAASAASADGKLTAGRLALIDGAAQESAATANKATVLAAVGTDFGTDTCTLTIRTTGGTAIADAQVYVGDDATPTIRTRVKTTDSLGQVKFDLTAGTTYYLWVMHNDYTGTNPTAFVAVAD
jgi:hypothetical protein